MFVGNPSPVEHKAEPFNWHRYKEKTTSMQSPRCLWWASVVAFLRFRFSVSLTIAPTTKPRRKTSLAFSFPLENSDALRDRWQSSLVPNAGNTIRSEVIPRRKCPLLKHLLMLSVAGDCGRDVTPSPSTDGDSRWTKQICEVSERISLCSSH